MRRHSAASEAPPPHSRIICEFPSTTNDQRVNLWPENGYRRPCKVKKASKKNEMAVSVLPTSNAYNDFRVKYHSVSGGSALSQSMKYAEAWLYGSLSVKPSPSRPTLFDYGRRKCAPLASVCRCSSARLGATTEDQGACNYAQSVPSTTAPASPTLCAAGKRGTPPSKCCDTAAAAGRREPLTDPYDAVRRSRLGGIRSERVARAKSHSPSDRKGADRRKSILDCDLNAYDLLKRNSSDEAGYASLSDEDCRRVAAAAASTPAAGDGKRKKKQRKLTFGYKSRTKLKEPSERGSAKVERETTFVDDVSIAGQKIRIFNVFDRTSPRSADVTTDDWISDPNDEVCVPPAPELQDADVTLSNNDSDDVAEVSVGGKHPLLLNNRLCFRGNNVREPVPQRPPRRRCSRSEESDSNVAIVVINPIANAAGGYIKSILKKPCSADEPAITAHHHTVVDVTTYASTTLDGANVAPDPCSVTRTSNYDAASGYICSGCERHLFAATCYCTLDGHRKKAKMGSKIKKQVQFKGMRGDVACGGGASSSRSGGTGAGAGDGEGAATLEEDESGSRLMDDADVSVVAATAETGYAIDVDRSITRSVAVVATADAPGAVRDPQPPRSPRLVCDVAGDYSRALPFASADCSPSSADVCSSVTHSAVPRRILSPPPSSSTPPPLSPSPSPCPPSQIVTILSDRLSSLPAAPTQSVALQQRQPSPPTPPSPPDVESASTSSLETLRKTYSTDPVASPAPPPTRSYALVAESSNEVFTSTLETGFGRRHNRHAIRSSSLCKLQRTLSECVAARPLLAGLHRKSFTDTMRLQMRSDGRPADARALFAAHQSPRRAAVAQPRSPGQGFRLALPDSGPVESALGNLPVPVTFASFESAAAFSPRHYLGDLSAVCSVDRGEPIFISVNESVDADGVRIPSLTRTFLQNRLCANNTATVAVASPVGVVACDQNRDRRAKSVIKINVSSASVAGVASTAENCTIVTIGGGASPTPSRGQHAVAAPASTVVRFDEQPAPPTASRKNNSVVRLNVSADEPLYSNCGPVDDTGNSSATATTFSSYATTDDGDAHDADFSLHYMSCEINGKLTEEEVGLSRTRPPTEKDEDEAEEVEEEEEEAYDAEPIYEEIPELAPPSAPPPPLPSKPPPEKVEDGGIVIPPRSIFEGASKYDILTYLAGAKERCRIPSEIPRFVIEEADTDAEASSADADVDELSRGIVADAAVRLSQRSSGFDAEPTDLSRRISHLSSVSDSSDELACFLACAAAGNSEKQTRKNSAEIERNDSGVGSETSQCSRSKWQQVRTNSLLEDQQLVCEDCDQVIESNNCENGPIYAPLVCRKCSKRRVERREIITEIVETEEKYGRDLRIILDEFYKPMLVAGLLTAEQLSSVFLNVAELLEHNTILAEKLRDGYEIAVEQGDEDLLTFNVGQIFLDATPMLHAFESYCTRQGNAALLLANLEREKELLKIFLRVSQMENTVLRRMNLNSFLMVPVQRVTKYPLLLARLYKVTPEHHVVQRELLKEARHNIELHLEHINSVTKDIGSTKIWRRISMINGRRVNGDIDDIISLKLQKIAVEVLEWGHDEVRFVMEGRLLYAQCTDCNWKRSGRTVKVVPINALLVTLGKPTENYNPELDDLLMFPQKNGIREASLLLMKEKSGKYSLVREPFFLDNCIIYCDGDYEEYFEVQEIHSKETYIFKGEDGERTKRWFRQLQYHCQGLGCWRRRRNALANIMINGMKIRNQ